MVVVQAKVAPELGSHGGSSSGLWGGHGLFGGGRRCHRCSVVWFAHGWSCLVPRSKAQQQHKPSSFFVVPRPSSWFPLPWLRQNNDLLLRRQPGPSAATCVYEEAPLLQPPAPFPTTNSSLSQQWKPRKQKNASHGIPSSVSQSARSQSAHHHNGVFFSIFFSSPPRAPRGKGTWGEKDKEPKGIPGPPSPRAAKQRLGCCTHRACWLVVSLRGA